MHIPRKNAPFLYARMGYYLQTTNIPKRILNVKLRNKAYNLVRV